MMKYKLFRSPGDLDKAVRKHELVAVETRTISLITPNGGEFYSPWNTVPMLTLADLL